MLLQAERAAAAERERLQHEEEERSLAKAQLAKLAKTVRDFEEQSARQSPPPAPAPSGRLGVEAEAAREEAMREMAALEQRAAELEQIENEQNASLARAQADLSRSKLAATAAHRVDGLLLLATGRDERDELLGNLLEALLRASRCPRNL